MSDHYRPEDEAPTRRLRAVLDAPIDEPPGYFAEIERERAAAWTLTCTRARWFATGLIIGSYLTWYWGIW